jgi:hypothetical protein
MKSSKIFTFIFLFGILQFSACKKKETLIDIPVENTDPLSKIENTYAFNLLGKIRGIWNGPVTSTTALGSFPEWIVDFRPISSNQISSKNELDSMNDIHMSFFIVKYKNQYRLAFRNGGSFGGQTRVSYLIADSVSETSTGDYYRFSEMVIGKKRAFTELIFKEDSLILKAFTNQYNTLETAVPHMTWKAKLQDISSCQAAVDLFNFPQKTLTKDFNATFSALSESIFYSITGGDPYSEGQQPYLGKTTVNYSFSSSLTPDVNKKVLLIITTQPLISGFNFNAGNLKYRSRYVILASNDNSYTFNYMHPGSYYLYTLYDADGNNTANSGDWINSNQTTFSVSALNTSSISAQINFTIP